MRSARDLNPYPDKGQSPLTTGSYYLVVKAGASVTYNLLSAGRFRMINITQTSTLCVSSIYDRTLSNTMRFHRQIVLFHSL